MPRRTSTNHHAIVRNTLPKKIKVDVTKLPPDNHAKNANLISKVGNVLSLLAICAGISTIVITICQFKKSIDLSTSQADRQHFDDTLSNFRMRQQLEQQIADSRKNENILNAQLQQNSEQIALTRKQFEIALQQFQDGKRKENLERIANTPKIAISELPTIDTVDGRIVISYFLQNIKKKDVHIISGVYGLEQGISLNPTISPSEVQGNIPNIYMSPEMKYTLKIPTYWLNDQARTEYRLKGYVIYESEELGVKYKYTFARLTILGSKYHHNWSPFDKTEVIEKL